VEPEVTTVPEAPCHWQLSGLEAKDDLTDLANRSLFEDEVQFAIDATGGSSLCLMLVDLEDLHTVNDQYGREVGDAVLIAVAERLRRSVRPRDLVARLEGDVFAVLFQDVEPAMVDGIAKRIMRTINESVFSQGQQVRVQANLGVAQANSSETAALLMAHAVGALAEAKAERRMHLAWFAEAAAEERE